MKISWYSLLPLEWRGTQTQGRRMSTLYATAAQTLHVTYILQTKVWPDQPDGVNDCLRDDMDLHMGTMVQASSGMEVRHCIFLQKEVTIAIAIGGKELSLDPINAWFLAEMERLRRHFIPAFPDIPDEEALSFFGNLVWQFSYEIRPPRRQAG